MEVYSKSDLENDSEEELLKKLKNAWDYDPSEPLEVYGTLREIVPLSGFSFYVLDSIKHIRSNEILNFPLSYEPSVQSVFVGDPSKFSLKDYKSGDIAKARVTFSPPEEREKHNNPFDLMTTALDGLISIDQEDEVFDFSKSTLHFSQVNNDTYLEEYLYNLHLKKALKEIDRSVNVKKAEVEIQLEQRKLEINKEIEELTKEEGLLKTNNDYIKSEISNLESQRDKAVSELSEIRESVSNTQSILEKSKTEYFKLIENLEQNMASLNETIEQKSEALLQLGLIEQEDINNLLLRYDSSEVREGHSFEEVFNSNYANAIEYIQAYLWNKGIVYKQSVLKDYLALLMSNDLIVLAGDSGSGKTNLVKSFAKAVGGEAIIIPVKPNWTSAEDLLGYYNPLESSYLSTKFLDALIEAQKNPHIPYFICLDEMNLARVEYYFADFLSLLEERDEQPVIQLFSSTEGDVLASELSNFVSLVNDTSIKVEKDEITSFIDVLTDEDFNSKLHEVCGFKDGESLLKYHSSLKKMINSFLNTPSSISLPKNVRIIGAINVDETTHYLSPKILDRAHVMKFSSPLLQDWDAIESEVMEFDIDISKPVIFDISDLGERKPYPEFDRGSELVQILISFVRDYLNPLGVEFGLRTIRQALNYSEALKLFELSDQVVLNNIVLHKILPKMLFDGEKNVNDTLTRKDILNQFLDEVRRQLNNLPETDISTNSVLEFEKIIEDAKSNDWVVNYWAR
ncbi:AAA family ATPase [uncultured Psychrobacter sp.]|uniref:McrB family protein n=1 Tax=uncultured Psychrobacter sp. TaxID=259303 RepID=UPI002597E442|nr:AAA family ATPase [uncultured Psychrobacter sp.]